MHAPACLVSAIVRDGWFYGWNRLGAHDIIRGKGPQTPRGLASSAKAGQPAPKCCCPGPVKYCPSPRNQWGPPVLQPVVHPSGTTCSLCLGLSKYTMCTMVMYRCAILGALHPFSPQGVQARLMKGSIEFGDVDLPRAAAQQILRCVSARCSGRGALRILEGIRSGVH